MGYRIYNALVASVMNALNMGSKNALFMLLNLLYRWGLGTAPALWADVLRATNLAGTYANGSSGVGATFTTSASYTTEDGITLRKGMLVFLTAQSTGAQRGLYSVTSIGATTVLTRWAGWDASAEMIAGSLFYVRQGTTYGGQVWAYTGSSSPTVGTDALTFAQDRLLRACVAATINVAQSFADGTLRVLNSAGTYYSTIKSAATANRTATLPDKTGTIAFTDDVQTVITAGAASLSNNTFYLGAPGSGTSTSSIVLGVGGAVTTTKAQLDVWCVTPAGAAQSCVFTVQKSSDDGATWNNTSATVSFGAADTSKHSGEVAVDVDYGELVRLKAVASATAATAGVFANIRLYN